MYFLLSLLGIFLLSLIMIRPFYGLILTVVALQLEYFLPSVGGMSSGRLIGILVAIGWMMRIASGRGTRVTKHLGINIPILAYLFFVTAGALLSQDMAASLSKVIKLGVLVIMLLMIEDLVDNRRHLVILLWVIAISYGLSSLPAVLQFRAIQAGGEAIGTVRLQDGGFRFSGLFSNPNMLAISLMSGIPFLFLFIREAGSNLRRLVYLGIFAMVLFSGLLTSSRTFLVSFGAFVFVYLAMELRFRTFGKMEIMMLIVLPVLGGLAFLLAPDYALNRLTQTADNSLYGRFQLFQKGFSLFGQSPLVGVGLGNAALFEPAKGYNMHDTISVMVGETGLLGTVLMLIICAVTLIKQGRTINRMRESGDRFLVQAAVINRCAFLALLLSWFGDIIFLQRMFWVYIAITAVLSRADIYQLLPRQNSHAEKTDLKLSPASVRESLPPVSCRE